MQLLREHLMAGDGIQAPGAIVLRYREGEYHPYVVHFRNDSCGGFHQGDYCLTREEADAAFDRRVKRYDPTGALHLAAVKS